VHSVNKRNKHHLHRTNANLLRFHKNAFLPGIKILNSLPPTITSLGNERAQFKVASCRYLDTHPFYSVNEFLIFKNNLYTVHENFIVFCIVEILYILNISYILCVHGFFFLHSTVILTNFWIHEMYLCKTLKLTGGYHILG